MTRCMLALVATANMLGSALYIRKFVVPIPQLQYTNEKKEYACYTIVLYTWNGLFSDNTQTQTRNLMCIIHIATAG